MKHLYYRLQFVDKKVSPEQWHCILLELRARLKIFKLLVHFQDDKLHFFLQCKQNPHGLNALIAPLQIDEACEVKLPSPRKRTLGFITKDLLHQILKITTKQTQPQRRALWAEVTFGWLSRITPQLRGFRLLLSQSHFWTQKRCIWRVSVEKFLSFDLSKSAQFSLETVKPKLKTSTEHELPLGDIGGILLTQVQSSRPLDLTRIDYQRHSLIVGQSGSGKSEFLRLAVTELFHKQATAERGIVIIDPHGAIYENIRRDISCYHLDPCSQQIQFFEGNIKPLAASELTADLIESQFSTEDPLDVRGKRVLRFVLFALYAAHSMSYENIARLLNDSEFRIDLLNQVNTRVVAEFFETEFPELRTRYYESAVLPILNIIGQYQLSVSNGPAVSFLDVLQKNRVIVVSIPQGRMGSRLTKLYGGTFIQQIFLYAQNGLLKQPLTIMIDELPLIYTPSFNQILAESRKFGLGFWTVQQYLSQLPREGLASLFANVSNYFCFKTNNDDAQLLAENINLEIESYTENKLIRTHRELASGTLLDLSRGELVSRFMINGKYIPATRLNTNIRAWDHLNTTRQRAR
jgi:hypothetical protein